ncbi:MAG: hypothetical protein MJA32_03880, partial [Proteobacteria bacterium]|nr:hypothetical protein [Pseudomonadota bacterium]
MNRPASPLLHDYKHSAAGKPAKSKALQWFAAGLGLPLVVVAILRIADSDAPPPPEPETPFMVAADASAPGVDDRDAGDIASEVRTSETAAPSQPEFDKITLEVGRGDTMEKLFRENALDVVELLTIARLDEAKKRFRSIKPGDAFEVEHDEGSIVSMYS